MADTRVLVIPGNTVENAAWWTAVDIAYPRLHAELVAGRSVFVSAAGWTTLTGVTGYHVDTTFAVTKADPASCAWNAASAGPHSSFSTLA